MKQKRKKRENELDKFETIQFLKNMIEDKCQLLFFFLYCSVV